MFHSFDLARELHRRNHLERIFSTWPWRRVQREGLPHEYVGTFPWIHTPDFLLARLGLMTRWLDDQASYANALAFDEYTLRKIPECDALIAISGSALKTGRLVQKRGGKFICDRGSSHARFQEQLLAEEYRRWNVEATPSDPRDIVREEAMYAEADAITVPSTFALESFVQMGISREKLHCIPYGVRLDRFSPVMEPPTDRFELVFVGSVGLRKGVPYLLQAFERLQHPRKRLRIVGSISREFQSVLERLPTANVQFLGVLPQAELPAVLSSSHAFVLPSVEEGLALVQAQALACGCPVIASSNTGSGNLFHHGIEGFILPPRDVDGLLSAMQRLADDPALQQEMRTEALKRVASLGGWHTYGDKWEQFLLNVTGNQLVS